jgi:hypothetical protein
MEKGVNPSGKILPLFSFSFMVSSIIFQERDNSIQFKENFCLELDTNITVGIVFFYLGYTRNNGTFA